jgi:hypothetical protein
MIDVEEVDDQLDHFTVSFAPTGKRSAPSDDSDDQAEHLPECGGNWALSLEEAKRIAEWYYNSLLSLREARRRATRQPDRGRGRRASD